MARRYWKRNEQGKLVEFFPNNKSSNDSPYLGKNPWARTTKIEFNQTTMDKDIAKRNKR